MPARQFARRKSEPQHHTEWCAARNAPEERQPPPRLSEATIKRDQRQSIDARAPSTDASEALRLEAWRRQCDYAIQRGGRATPRTAKYHTAWQQSDADVKAREENSARRNAAIAAVGAEARRRVAVASRKGVERRQFGTQHTAAFRRPRPGAVSDGFRVTRNSYCYS